MFVDIEMYHDVEKSAEVEDFLRENRQSESNYYDKMYDYQAIYSYSNLSGFVDKHTINPHESVEKTVFRSISAEFLENAFSRLSAAQCDNLVRRFYDGQSYVYIAKCKGVDESAVRHSVERALKNLRKMLTGTGITSSDFAPMPTPVVFKNTTKRAQRKVERFLLDKCINVVLSKYKKICWNTPSDSRQFFRIYMRGLYIVLNLHFIHIFV